MSNTTIGHIRKMKSALNEQGDVNYQLPLDEQLVDMNQFIGKPLKLVHTGNIHCCNCGKKTKKSYSQGHCFVCMKKLASCDMCIMKPETCHYDQGTCREPEWGQANCFVPHYVYLSNTSGLKVGITRHTQLPTRWIDQGATQALAILKVASRQLSGLIEVELAKMIADKTNWRAMLKGDESAIDLTAKTKQLIAQIEPKLVELSSQFGADAIERLDIDPQSIRFPVTVYPSKIASHNFDKNPEVSGILQGIKGQYLIFDTGVINLRKFTSYEIELS
ncbi:DUF2797 domain-containing protein [Shewanella waksmanii]|uniref:DUF2797 domain-containing protein n=1 Tax=Shewanella waksmanii TaxID=213783 RepID=UPI003734C442